jgi:hypothetical protein
MAAPLENLNAGPRAQAQGQEPAGEPRGQLEAGDASVHPLGEGGHRLAKLKSRHDRYETSEHPLG